MERKKITPDGVYHMCSIGCTVAEIAQKYGVPVSHVNREYEQELGAGRAALVETIREAQIDCALNKKGDATMLMFLGRVYLHQCEKAVEEKMADLDLLLEHLNRQAKCSNYLKSNFEATPNQTLE